MKRSIALAVAALASQAVATFAGEPSPKEVISPAPPPPEYFRPNEWDIGAFATYWTGTGNNLTGTRGELTTIPRGRTVALEICLRQPFLEPMCNQ